MEMIMETPVEKIVINDGTKSYQIVNQNGKALGVFCFNPSDVNIVEKYNQMVDEVSEALAKVDNGEEEAIKEVSGIIRNKMDYLFGEETSKSFFTITSPLTPLSNGQLFIENVITAIGKVIEHETKRRVAEVRERMNKYTAKYQ